MAKGNITLDSALVELGLMRIKRLNQSTRNGALEVIHTYFPEVWSDIQGFAEAHKLNAGDVAGKVVGEIISPMLSSRR